MQASEIISNVRSELVEANASFWSDAELLRLINQAEKDFVQKTRCLRSKHFLSVVAGQQDYVLPNNVLGSLVVFVKVTTGATVEWKRVRPTNLEKASQVNENHPSSDSTLRADPIRYWLVGRTVYFDPIFSATEDSKILMFFQAKPIPLISVTNELNIDDSLSDAIEHYVLRKCWKKEQEDVKAAEHKQEYDEMVRQGHKYVKKLVAEERNRFDLESGSGFDFSTY